MRSEAATSSKRRSEQCTLMLLLSTAQRVSESLDLFTRILYIPFNIDAV